MQLASYVQSGLNKVGAVSGEDIIDLHQLFHTLTKRPELGFSPREHFPRRMRHLLTIDLGWLSITETLLDAAKSMERAELLAIGALAPISECTWRQPVTDPAQIICVGRNYAAHAAEGGRTVTEIPFFFMRSTASLVAAGESILRPAVSEMHDWEGELAIIIGRPARHVSVDDALNVVAGYSLFNDGSIRDWQWGADQMTAGKNFYRSGAFGPFVTTADVIPDPQALRIETRLNGEVMQDAPTRDMIRSCAELISFISAYTRLEPGDVIATGTPSGVGSRRKPPIWLKDGDAISVEIDGLGTLTNPVVDEIEPAGTSYQYWRIPPANNE